MYTGYSLARTTDTQYEYFSKYPKYFGRGFEVFIGCTVKLGNKELLGHPKIVP